MRVPSFRTVLQYARGIGLILSGMIIGSALFMMIYQHNFSELIKINVALRSQIEDLQSEIKGLSEDQDHHSSIRTLSVYVEKSEQKIDEMIESEIKQRVKKSLNSLVGQSSDTFDPAFSRELFGEKLYPNIHGRDYIVTIRTMLISKGTLHIWIDLRVYQKIQ